MSFRHSIGLRLIRWGERLLDEVSEQPMHDLRGCEVHADAGAYDGLGCRVGVNDALREGKIDSAVVVPGLAYEIDMGDGAVIPRNHPSLISYLEALRFNPNHVALTHQPLLGNSINHIASFGQAAQGVES